ncbi:MAG TPA: EMC3/TMCO1 family protein [Candidatus Norongarragalinales archaeon]|nr:EMC3/TMCO1 family protein [Candidatus Norongarragalinales archaeon]
MDYMGIPAWALIFLSAVAFSVLTSYISRKTGIRQKTDHIQKSMKEYQKEYNEALKKDDKKRIEELKAREPEVMKMMNEMMFLPFKNMIFVIPLFIGVMWVLGIYFNGFLIELPIALHLNGNELLGLNIFHSSQYGSRGFFILSSVVAGLVIEQVWSKVLNRKKT